MSATLAACGGDSSSNNVSSGGGGDGAPTPIEPAPPLPGNPEALPQATYPISGMSEVPVTTQAMLRYSDSVHEQTEILDRIGLLKNPREEGEEEVDVTITLADRGRTVVVTPVEKLEPFTTYDLYRDFAGDESPEHDEHEHISYRFTTGGDPEGDQDARSYDPNELTIEGLRPRNPGIADSLQTERILHFSTPRVIHTQPVDPETVRYGDGEDDNMRLTRQDNGEFVDAKALIDGRNIVLDLAEPMAAGVLYNFTYSGQTGTAVESIYGQPFTPLNQVVSKKLNPLAAETGWEVEYQGTEYSLPEEVNAVFGSTEQNSPWTDRWVNALAGNVDAELAVDLAHFPYVWYSPVELYHFRIRKESLAGQALEPVERNLGEGAGTVEVTFPADITGYVVLEEEGILGRLYTYLNIALDGEEPRFVATEMAAYATVNQSGDMTLEAVAALDPALLGQERAPGNGMFSFQIRVPNAFSE